MSTISAVILYNNDNYGLRRAVLSVIDQSVKCDEIIIVYKKGIEEINSVLFDVCKDYSSIHCICGEFDTELDGFMIGVGNSVSDYVAFLNSDDYWDENKIEICRKCIDNSNSEIDLMITSYSHKVFLEEIPCDINKYVIDKHAEYAFFQFLYAPSSVIVKTSFAIFAKMEDFFSINPQFINEILSHHYSNVGKDIKELERIFWKNNLQLIRKSGILDKAIDYSLATFHGLKYTIDNLTEFLDNVELSNREVVELMIKKPIVWNNNKETEQIINQKTYNYLLVRDWLELKIKGRSIEQQLMQKNFEHIAIYGAGKHGTILYNDLEDSNVSVVAWIDKNKRDRSYMGKKVIYPCEFSGIANDVDAIVVSINTDIKELRQSLNNVGDKPIVLLSELIRN